MNQDKQEPKTKGAHSVCSVHQTRNADCPACNVLVGGAIMPSKEKPAEQDAGEIAAKIISEGKSEWASGGFTTEKTGQLEPRFNFEGILRKKITEALDHERREKAELQKRLDELIEKFPSMKDICYHGLLENKVKDHEKQIAELQAKVDYGEHVLKCNERAAAIIQRLEAANKRLRDLLTEAHGCVAAHSKNETHNSLYEEIKAALGEEKHD